MSAPRPRRLGIMGGTFDPIHIGHLVCAEEARWQFNLDEVIFVPAGSPWQKRAVTGAEDRYLLTMLATAGNPHFSVSRIEVDRPGPTYTRETLSALADFHGEAADLFFITGADAVLEILTWKDPDAVLDAASFIAASRPGYDLGRLELERFGDRVRVIEIPALAISSTDIRRRVREGRPIQYLVPPEVAAFIDERGLYRGSDDANDEDKEAP
ncbi:MAG TPA: nicotinate-nucleotide adenylyltransferase [Actinomycetota bacterium]|nr:nicotinate-nucleotide adenylyltransferase [Actinomycetota bacterium]